MPSGFGRVPGERMKSGRVHLVPLCSRAIEILQALPREADSNDGYIFVGARAERPLSNMAMLELLRELRPGLTVHGFRSSFRDWAGDMTHYPREVLEAALAHVVADETEAAYRRSTAVQKRRLLMGDWERYCAMPVTGAKILAIGRAVSPTTRSSKKRVEADIGLIEAAVAALPADFEMTAETAVLGMRLALAFGPTNELARAMPASGRQTIAQLKNIELLSNELGKAISMTRQPAWEAIKAQKSVNLS